jgi:hypothetical protein
MVLRPASGHPVAGFLLLKISQGINSMIMSRLRPQGQGRSTSGQKEPTAKARPDRAAREALKKDRERDATAAMKEYEAERRAVLVNTERLRALRLAKEAGETPDKTAKTAKKGS